MADYEPTSDKVTKPRSAHFRTFNWRDADRIKTVILLVFEWRAEDDAEALWVDPNTLLKQFKCYSGGGLPELLKVEYRKSESQLNDAQLDPLGLHFQQHLYLSAKVVEA